MVFQTLQLLVRSRGPDEFWRKRKIFKLAAHFRGRARNCYSNTIRAVHRALQYATVARKLKRDDLRQLRDTRIEAGCEQHKITKFQLRDSLYKYEIHLDRKSLADIAIWEPRTFKALTEIAAVKCNNTTNSEAKHIFLTDNSDDYLRTNRIKH